MGQGMGATSACQQQPFPDGIASVQVRLNIYNIGKSIQMQCLNQVLKTFDIGAFHCGVEIFGVEWSYSDMHIPGMPDVKPTGTGIFSCRPRDCEDHSYSESIPMGKVAVTEWEVQDLLTSLRPEWPLSEYDLFKKNCCHFSNEFCKRLGVGDIPSWVTNLVNKAIALEATETACCKTVQCHEGHTPCHGSSILCCGPNEAPAAQRGQENHTIEVTSVFVASNVLLSSPRREECMYKKAQSDELDDVSPSHNWQHAAAHVEQFSQMDSPRSCGHCAPGEPEEPLPGSRWRNLIPVPQGKTLSAMPCSHGGPPDLKERYPARRRIPALI